MSEKLQKWRTLNIHSAPLYPLWQVIPSKLPRSGLRRCESVLVVASVYVSVNFFFFFLREVLVDNLLPAAVAASCSSQQWEKEPGRRVGRRSAGGAGRAAAGGGKKAQDWFWTHYCASVKEITNHCVSCHKKQNTQPPAAGFLEIEQFSQVRNEERKSVSLPLNRYFGAI